MNPDLANTHYRVTQMEGRLAPFAPSGDDVAALARAFERADACSMQIGPTTPKPVPGDTPARYRRHLLETFKAHAPKFKDGRFESLPAEHLDWVEEQVYADAVRASHDPASHKPGEMRRHRHRDDAGRTITTWTGDSMVWLQHFYQPGARGFFRSPK